MKNRFERTIALIGEDKFDSLKAANVLLVGLGGVGGAALEVLTRSGIGSFTLVDGDAFEPSNLNRQILCTTNEIGMKKAEAAKYRALAINPEAKVTAVSEFLTESNVEQIAGAGFTYCVDAIDDVKSKVALIVFCKNRGIPVVSALGAGNRVDCEFFVTDIYKTKDDPLARKLRGELRKKNVASLDVVCAANPPVIKCGTPLSVAAPPFVMGAMLANHAVKQILHKE